MRGAGKVQARCSQDAGKVNGRARRVYLIFLRESLVGQFHGGDGRAAFCGKGRMMMMYESLSLFRYWPQTRVT